MSEQYNSLKEARLAAEKEIKQRMARRTHARKREEERQDELDEDEPPNANNTVTVITVLGASGDLAKNKVYPALWTMYRKSLIPRSSVFVGYARSKFTSEEFMGRLRPHLEKSFRKLNEYIALRVAAKGKLYSNRIFYLALPALPIIETVTEHLSKHCQTQFGRTQVVANKSLSSDLLRGFEEEQICRMDHSRPKEMAQNWQLVLERLSSKQDSARKDKKEGVAPTLARLERFLAQTELADKVKDRVRAIANSTCGKKVSFAQDHMGDNGVRVVAEALRSNTCIEWLELDSNRISDDGAVALAEVLKRNATIMTLDLNNNRIRNDGAVALAQMLKHNTTITTLKLGFNSISDDGAVALAGALVHNTTLHELSLWRNYIAPAGGAALAAALNQNRTLNQLSLEKNSAATASAFGAALPVDRELNAGDWVLDNEGESAFNEARKEKMQQHVNLFLVCKSGDTKALISLINQDHAPVNQQDEQGDAPLHVACRHKHLAIVKLLLDKGADTSVKNAKGETPYDVATASGHVAIISIEALKPDSKPQQQQKEKGPPAPAPFAKSKRGGEAAQGPEKARRERLQQRMREVVARFNATMAGRAKLIFIGQGRAGKTSTFHSLMGHTFNKHEHSTPGAATADLAVIVESMDIHDWQELDAEISELMRSLCGTALAQDSGVNLQMKQAMMKAKADLESRIVRYQQQQKQSEALKTRPRARTTNLKQKATPKETQSQQPFHESPTIVPEPTKASHAPASASKQQVTIGPSSKGDTASHDNEEHGSRATATGMSTEEMEKAIKELNVDAVMGEGKARVTFKVFDLGGQSTFYIFHPFFLTEYAVYLLVFSMKDLLHQDESKRAESWEFMEHWLSSLHLHAKGAPVLIVGTFADKIIERKQHEAISRDIYSRLRHNPAFPGVIHNDKHGLWFWPVDNTKSINDTMIQDLRQTISSTALAQEYVSQEVAVPYLHLFDKLHAIARDEKRPLLTFDEVVDIARTCGLRTRDETRACLQFLHLYSMVLCYDHVPGMEDYVILSPQWAVDTMARVIRNFDLHRDVRDGEARAVGAQLWDDLVDRGILHRRLLDVLWNDVDSNLVLPFLCLMMQYGLCVEYSPPKLVDSRRALARTNSGHGDNATAKGSKGSSPGHQQYLVPAILPMTIRHNNSEMASVSLSTTAAQQVNPYVGYEEKTAYVTFSLKQFKRSASVRVEDVQQASFLPEGLFTVVLAHVMMHAQHGASQEPKLSRTHAVCFMESTKLELQLVPAVGGIKMKITSAQPRAVLHMLHSMISEAARERYPELKSSLLLPFDDKTLLFFEDMLHHHKRKQDMWVDEQLLSPDDLVTKYGPLLPVLGLQDKYDVFISYRQRASSGLVMALHPRLEQRNLVAFLDANNLETGLNFKLSFMTAIGLSLVACPIVSAATIMQMRQLQHSDYCDNVLLEWMTMLALREYQRAHEEDEEQHAKIRLHRVVPVIVGSAWHNVNDSSMSKAEVSEYDSFDRLKRLTTKLPDVVSKETAAALDQYFSQVLHLPPPQQHKSVRETVLSLFDIDAVVVLDATEDRTSQLRDIAEKVRQVVVSARSDEQAGNGAATARRSTQPILQSSLSYSTTATTPAPPPPATPLASSSSSPFEPELAAWLTQHSLLPHVKQALVEHCIDSLEVLVGVVREGLLTTQALVASGVPMGAAFKLVQKAKRSADGNA
ncbi:hypothetical protein PTSG_05418 [Salpingoeca rosetta]|uniref:non-specific serine/threonine protein kinase n=1 Tax=Salpingoeca rosetta (strain ATCC 50818 / BSB-021) TaxID=946362 RepID=F2UAD6_SALR5|nr:uncharacterized protein PTSG_05418 [Salpingoeca rosetta]EGD73711.1 hypothetical protein PTSG_05418 [Salpingoeca rosetta]|eukprot:XP_004993992.1 hypothetical protein PTSG_05418 [Salpingoeca rosetta]